MRQLLLLCVALCVMFSCKSSVQSIPSHITEENYLKADSALWAEFERDTDPILSESIKACFLNGTAIESIVVYNPHQDTVDEYFSDDFPDNIEDIIDYQGFDGNTINM